MKNTSKSTDQFRSGVQDFGRRSQATPIHSACSATMRAVLRTIARPAGAAAIDAPAAPAETAATAAAGVAKELDDGGVQRKDGHLPRPAQPACMHTPSIPATTHHTQPVPPWPSGTNKRHLRIDFDGKSRRLRLRFPWTRRVS